MCRDIRVLVLVVLSTPVLVAATIKEGRVAALTLRQGSDAGNWNAGRLVLIDVPSLQKTTLDDRECFGPCFSPDGDRIAYVSGPSLDRSWTQNPPDTIYTVATDGSEPPVSTGILVEMNPPADWGWWPAAHPALFWIRKGDGDWFYWVQRVRTGRGVFRAKLGTAGAAELVYTPPESVDGFFWGAFDSTATHVAATMDWTVYRIDIVNQTYSAIDGGCNPAVSPGGNLIMNNLGFSSDRCNANWGYEHGGCQVLNWNDLSCSRAFVYAGNAYDVQCNGDMNKWSHHDEDIVMWRAFDQGNVAGCTVADHGVIADRITDERLSLGPYTGWDFYPGTVGPDTTTAEPAFSPAGGTVEPGELAVTVSSSTVGATIMYTTDGSEPTGTNGTQIASGGAMSITVGVGQSVLVRARAFAPGHAQSIVSEARYTAAEAGPSITLITPNGGEEFQAGQTITVTWTVSPGFTPSGFVVTYSVDDGETWQPAYTGPTALPPSTRRFEWQIPPATPATSYALVDVHDYSAPSNADQSDVAFTIRAATATMPHDRRSSGVPSACAGSRDFYSLRGERLDGMPNDSRTGTGVYVSRNAANAVSIQLVGARRAGHLR
jgi:hypothetical protein